MHRVDPEALKAQVEELTKELTGTQEMLAYVLNTVGEPVRVSKESLQRGLPEGTQISVVDDLEGECFVFSLGSEEQ